MPSCFLPESSVRVRQKIQSAMCASRGPDLGAVDRVMRAVLGEHGLGLEAGKVRSGAGLRVALTPVHLAVADVRQEAVLLLFAAVGHEHGGEHADTEGQVPGQVLATAVSCSQM